MTSLLLGPIQRGTGTGEVRVWVETSGPCTVEVLGRTAASFEVLGHHYALVVLGDLPAGADEAYEVRLDGEVAWPPPDDERPPPRIRTWDGRRPIALVVGSCRQGSVPGAPAGPADGDDTDGPGADALVALGRRLLAGTHRSIDGLVLLGDQVYADSLDEPTVAELRRRRGAPAPPGWPEVSSFEDYACLYQLAWTEPTVRWLLASVPSVMIFDDHEIIDDWNSSIPWRDEVERTPWWPGRIEGGLASYWLYQHLGNMGAEELARDELLARVRGDGGDEALRRFARDAGSGGGEGGALWSHAHPVGGSRLVVVDSRAGRSMAEDDRSMLGEQGWEWLEGELVGDVDHLLVATSIPWLLPRAIHDVEAWSDEVTSGAWRGVGRRLAERLRRTIDLEHWASFGRSFERLAELVGAVSEGRRGEAPATVTVLSGDVHFGYVAEVDLGGASRVRQVVVSPFRQGLEESKRRAVRLATSLLGVGSRLLAATAPGALTDLRWDITTGPWFGDQLGVLELDGRRAALTVEGCSLDERGLPVLRILHRVEL